MYASTFQNPAATNSQIPTTARIGVIGAGPAGISAAYYLKKQGYSNVTLLDSAPHIAGKSSTFFVNDRGYDVGALMVGTNYTNIKSLAQELDCPLDKFTGRSLDFDSGKILVDNTNKIGIYTNLLPHMNKWLEQKITQSLDKASAPGHGQLSELNLYSPISQWMKDHRCEYLRDTWELAYTSAGYGFIDDDIPAAYFLKFIENSENTIWYFPQGFSSLWEKMIKDTHVILNATVTNVDRSLKRIDDSHPILVTYKNSETDFQQTLAFDHIIVATNPRDTEKFLDVTPLEHSCFEQVVTFDFYTIIATVEGLSTKVGMTTIPKHCQDKSSTGHITAYYCAYNDVPTYAFYAYGSKEIRPENVLETFKEDIAKMGCELKEIHYNKKWDFFPHVSSLSMARGFYSKVENNQGQDGTFYVGGWLDFELTENVVSYSKDFVQRFFNQDSTTVVQHSPISPPIQVIPEATINWGTVLRLAAKRFPDKVAFIWCDSKLQEEQKITYQELYHQARATADYLVNTAHHKKGDRVLLCYAPGLRFLPVLFGCMMVGVIAVPVAPPNLATADKDIARFTYLSKTTGANLVFSDKNYMLYTTLYAAKSFFGMAEKIKWPENLIWVEGENIVTSKQLLPENMMEQVDCESVAILQFSSGSTGNPKGVMLTHKNLVHNVDLMQAELGLNSDSTIAFWVPQFHDLGLIGGFLNTVRAGCRSVVMSPLSFLQNPENWLQMITRYQATFTAAPNFAYELATRKTKPESIAKLDFSSLRGAFNGAEPVRWATLEGFAKKFGPAGFKLSMFKCLYGLAEHCAYTIGFRNMHDVPTVLDIDPIELRSGCAKIRRNSETPNNIVATGVANHSMQIEIRVVDPVTRQLCSPLTVGEVWMNSPSVGKGYFGRDDISEQTFRAQLDNTDHGNWITDHGSFLKTGDLGFMYNNELFITGREKDVIIINGKNHYPQDIEFTSQESHKSIRPGCVAAIHHSDPKTGTDSLIILAEVRVTKGTTQEEYGKICDAIETAVPAGHGLPCERIVLLKPQSLPKTTSGKLQRSRTKDMLMKGDLDKQILKSVGEVSKEPKAKPKLRPSNIIPVMKISEIQQKITRQVQRVSKIASRVPFEEIDIDANLINVYGFDSLAAVQLTACLKEEFGIEVAPQLLLDLPTISGLADHILKKMPKNPVFTAEPETIIEATPIDEIITTITGQVQKVSKQAAKLPLDQINVNANLVKEYGMDSLTAVQLTAMMSQNFGVEIAPALLYDVHTIVQLAEHVQKKLQEKRPSSPKYSQVSPSFRSKIIIPLAPKNALNKHNPPLFCIHPLMGNVASYIPLARMISIARPVYGIQAPADIEPDVVLMAERYIKALQEAQPIGPYFICGYSFGGLIAWEMGRQLSEMGQVVGGLYLIDAPSPLQQNVRRPLNPDDQPEKIWRREIEQLLNDVDSQWMLKKQNEDPEQFEELKKHIGLHIAAMYGYKGDIASLDAAQPFPIHYWRAKDYGKKSSKLLLDHPLFYTPNFGWERYTGKIEIHKPVPGHHYSVLREENCGRLAREFNQHMPIINNRRTSTDLKPLMLERTLQSNSPISTGNTLVNSPKRIETFLSAKLETVFNEKSQCSPNSITALFNVQVPAYLIAVSMIVSFAAAQYSVWNQYQQ